MSQQIIKYVYQFGGGKADGNESMKNLLGGKGANLAEMAGHPSLLLPVPPWFYCVHRCLHLLLST
jgi:pyruvate,orthophosphate dikinase